MKRKLAEKKLILQEKEEERKRHDNFTQFLIDVVNMKDGDKEGFESIPDLQNRFKSLKNENKQLRDRKAQINREMEQARQDEKNKLNELNTLLYEKQRKMQEI